MPDSESTAEAYSYAFLLLLTALVTYITLNPEANDGQAVVKTSLQLWLIIRFSCLFIVIVALFTLGTTMYDRLSDTALSPSILGFASGIGLLISISIIQLSTTYRRFVDLLYIILFLTVLLLSVHKSSIIALFLTLLVSFLIFHKNLQTRYLFIIFVAAVIVVYSIYDIIEFYLMEYINPINPFAQNLSTFTGRTTLWTRVFNDYINNIYHLICGYGYHSFSRVFFYAAGERIDFLSGAGESHNATLAILFETGIVGLAFFMYFIGQSIAHIFRLISYHSPDPATNILRTILRIILFTFILFLLIFGVTAGSYGQPNRSEPYLMVCVVVMISTLHAKLDPGTQKKG